MCITGGKELLNLSKPIISSSKVKGPLQCIFILIKMLPETIYEIQAVSGDGWCLKELVCRSVTTELTALHRQQIGILTLGWIQRTAFVKS